jgi:hypothetical protein
MQYVDAPLLVSAPGPDLAPSEALNPAVEPGSIASSD